MVEHAHRDHRRDDHHGRDHRHPRRIVDAPLLRGDAPRHVRRYDLAPARHGSAATINGFTLDRLTGDATITPTSFSGSLDAVAHLDLGNGGAGPTGALHANFDGAALHASVHVGVGDQAVVIGTTSLQLHGASIDATFDADVEAHTNRSA